MNAQPYYLQDRRQDPARLPPAQRFTEAELAAQIRAHVAVLKAEYEPLPERDRWGVPCTL